MIMERKTGRKGEISSKIKTSKEMDDDFQREKSFETKKKPLKISWKLIIFFGGGKEFSRTCRRKTVRVRKPLYPRGDGWGRGEEGRGAK